MNIMATILQMTLWNALSKKERFGILIQISQIASEGPIDNVPVSVGSSNGLVPNKHGILS